LLICINLAMQLFGLKTEISPSIIEMLNLLLRLSCNANILHRNSQSGLLYYLSMANVYSMVAKQP